MRINKISPLDVLVGGDRPRRMGARALRSYAPIPPHASAQRAAVDGRLAMIGSALGITNERSERFRWIAVRHRCEVPGLPRTKPIGMPDKDGRLFGWHLSMARKWQCMAVFGKVFGRLAPRAAINNEFFRWKMRRRIGPGNLARAPFVRDLLISAHSNLVNAEMLAVLRPCS